MSDNYNRKHPESSFNTEYPYNKATITRSGHEIHINDAPGMESLKISHTKGTYVEINEDGKWTKVVVDKAYDYYKDGFSETVDGHKDIKVVGALRTIVDNSQENQVAGNSYTAIGGDNIIGTEGTKYEHVSSDWSETTGSNKISLIQGEEQKNIIGNKIESVGKNKIDMIKDQWSVVSGNSIEMQSDGTIRFKCKKFVVDAEEIVLTTSSGDIRITAGGIINALGQQIRLND